MTDREIIEKAKALLVSSRYLTSELNMTGRVIVRVPVLPPHTAPLPPEFRPHAFFVEVRFYMKEHEAWGLRLMVEYNGRTEFAA